MSRPAKSSKFRKAFPPLRFTLFSTSTTSSIAAMLHRLSISQSSVGILLFSYTRRSFHNQLFVPTFPTKSHVNMLPYFSIPSHYERHPACLEPDFCTLSRPSGRAGLSSDDGRSSALRPVIAYPPFSFAQHRINTLPRYGERAHAFAVGTHDSLDNPSQTATIQQLSASSPLHSEGSGDCLVQRVSYPI